MAPPYQDDVVAKFVVSVPDASVSATDMSYPICFRIKVHYSEYLLHYEA